MSYRQFRILHYRELKNKIRRKYPPHIEQVIVDCFARLTATIININRDKDKSQAVSEDEVKLKYGPQTKPKELSLDDTELMILSALGKPIPEKFTNGESSNPSS